MIQHNISDIRLPNHKFHKSKRKRFLRAPNSTFQNKKKWEKLTWYSNPNLLRSAIRNFKLTPKMFPRFLFFQIGRGFSRYRILFLEKSRRKTLASTGNRIIEPGWTDAPDQSGAWTTSWAANLKLVTRIHRACNPVVDWFRGSFDV